MLIELVGGPLDGTRYNVPDDYVAIQTPAEREKIRNWWANDSPSAIFPQPRSETHVYRMRVDFAGEPVTVEGRVLYDHAGAQGPL